MPTTKSANPSGVTPTAISLPPPPLPPTPEATPVTTAPPAQPDPVVVTVDGVSLTRSEVQRQVEETLTALARGGKPIPQKHRARQKAKRFVVDSFIAGTLLDNEARRRGITVPEEEIQKALERPPTRQPGEAPEQAVSDADLRKTVERNLRIRTFVDSAIRGKTDVQPKEIETFYKKNRKAFRVPEQVHARHILIECNEGCDGATRKAKRAEAQALRERIAQGEDFAAIAAQHSACPSAAEGGDLGFFPRGAMTKPFAKAVFSQELDAVGKVIETKFGYHIVQVLGRREPFTRTLEEARNDIETHLRQGKKRKATEKLIKGLRKKAKIVFPKR